MTDKENRRIELLISQVQGLRDEFLRFRENTEKELRRISERLAAAVLALKIIGSVSSALFAAGLLFLILK